MGEKMLYYRSDTHIDPAIARRNPQRRRARCSDDADAARGCWDPLAIRQVAQTLRAPWWVGHSEGERW